MSDTPNMTSIVQSLNKSAIDARNYYEDNCLGYPSPAVCVDIKATIREIETAALKLAEVVGGTRSLADSEESKKLACEQGSIPRSRLIYYCTNGCAEMKTQCVKPGERVASEEKTTWYQRMFRSIFG